MKSRLSLVFLAVILVFATVAVATGPSSNAKASRVEGLVAGIDIDAQQLVVGEVTVQVTPSTVIWLGEEVVALDALEVGMTVVACGIVDEDGVLWAHRINVKYVGL